MTPVEAGHTGEIQADYERLLPGFFICEGAPCLGVRQAEDGYGGSTSGDGQVDERGVVADMLRTGISECIMSMMCWWSSASSGPPNRSNCPLTLE